MTAQVAATNNANGGGFLGKALHGLADGWPYVAMMATTVPHAVGEPDWRYAATTFTDALATWTTRD